MQLVVIQQFGNYQKGQMISNADDVKRILESSESVHVVKVADAPVADTKSTDKSGG